MATVGSETSRVLGLWLCLAVFVARVLGQFEVLLHAPPWLPRFEAWSSGLIPYSILLPVQVLLVAWMAVIASHHARRDGSFRVRDPRNGTLLRALAAIYAVSMLLRLLVTLAYPPHTLLDRGLIPIVAHWSLAVFMYFVAATPGETRLPSRGESLRPRGSWRNINPGHLLDCAVEDCGTEVRRRRY
jgi:hypothetical protein